MHLGCSYPGSSSGTPSPCDKGVPLKKAYPVSCSHERDKRLCYEKRVLEVKHGSFTPLVFSSVGGIGQAATVRYQQLVSLLAEKHGQSYLKTVSWIQCMLNFSLLRSCITCIRGSHSTANSACQTAALSEGLLDLVAREGRIPNY